VSQQPRVSVIIPAYNSEAYVARAIQSALDQDYENKEIIIIDDGSRDHTRPVVLEFGDAVHYIEQEHAGAPAARNRGIRESAGEFIAFLDSDDEYLPGRLTRCLQPLLEDETVGMTFCWATLRHPDGFEELRGADFERMCPYPRPLWPSPLQCTPTTTVRRAALDAAGPFDEALHSREDQDLWIRLRETGGVAAIEEPLVIVHARTDSLSANPDLWSMEADIFRILNRAFKRRPKLYEPDRDLILADACWLMGANYLIQQCPHDARSRLLLALNHKWSFRLLPALLASSIPIRLTTALRQLKHRRRRGA
jgi:glycosyltransferase involved in cell wall biosynthesis